MEEIGTNKRILLNVGEAAQRLGIGRSKFYQELLSGRCQSVTVGKRRLIPVISLDAYVARLITEQALDGD